MKIYLILACVKVKVGELLTISVRTFPGVTSLITMWQVHYLKSPSILSMFHSGAEKALYAAAVFSSTRKKAERLSCLCPEYFPLLVLKLAVFEMKSLLSLLLLKPCSASYPLSASTRKVSLFFMCTGPSQERQAGQRLTVSRTRQDKRDNPAAANTSPER